MSPVSAIKDDTIVAGAPTIRVALITGAAQGIGREIALRLARDGLDVALNDIPSNVEVLQSVCDMILKQAGVTGSTRRCIVVPGDVSKEDEVAGVVEKTVKEFGGLDVMVANAGIIVIQPLVDMNVDEFDRLMNINVRGVMLCYKHAARQMIKQGRGGRIIGASSVAGKMGLPYLCAYSTSKFAIRGLTQCAAMELGGNGITVNAYAPGPIQSTMMGHYDGRVSEIESSRGRQEGDFMKELSSRAALGRFGVASEVASLVSYLASEEARYITGQSIVVDGGIYFD